MIAACELTLVSLSCIWSWYYHSRRWAYSISLRLLFICYEYCSQ